MLAPALAQQMHADGGGSASNDGALSPQSMYLMPLDAHEEELMLKPLRLHASENTLMEGHAQWYVAQSLHGIASNSKPSG